MALIKSNLKNGGAAKFTIEYYSASPLASYGYQYISKQFLDDNGYTNLKVTTTDGSSYLLKANTKGGTTTGIATVHAGSSQDISLSTLDEAYLLCACNQSATFEFT